MKRSTYALVYSTVGSIVLPESARPAEARALQQREANQIRHDSRNAARNTQTIWAGVCRSL